MSKADFDLIEAEIAIHQIGSRTRSAALLAWFIHAVWRMEPEDVDDAICDGAGDKGFFRHRIADRGLPRIGVAFVNSFGRACHFSLISSASITYDHALRLLRMNTSTQVGSTAVCLRLR